MRILMLNHEYPPHGGGSGVAMQHLAEALVPLGHDVRVLTTGVVEEQSYERGVQVCRMPISMAAGELAGLRSWLSFLCRGPNRLRRAVADFEPDVINSHFLFPAGYVVHRSRVNPVHVASVVGADIHDPTRRISADRNWLVRRLTRTAVVNCFAVTTPSRDLTQRTRQLLPGSSIRTISWGVPKLTPVRMTREEMGIPHDDVVISTLGRLVRRKRIDVIVEAIGRLSNRCVRLVVMGSGPEESSLRGQVEALGITKQVHFAGRVSDEEKAAWLQASDIFCLVSEHEGFGLVYLEAMGLSTAVIAADIGGQKDIIRHGVDGYLVPVGDVVGLRDKIRVLSENRQTLVEMKKNAQGRAQEFLPERTADEFRRLFEDAIASQ